MGRLRWSFRFFPVLAAAVFLTAAASGEKPRLVLMDENNRELYSLPVSEGDAFTLRFTHSYARSLVEEIFVVTGPDQFTLRETRYEDFGAGLPHEPEPGQIMTFGNGKIRITGYDALFTDLRIRVGHIANHHIIINDTETIRLADLVRPGGEIGVRVVTVEHPDTAWRHRCRKRKANKSSILKSPP